jgi:hypothetical protein
LRGAGGVGKESARFAGPRTGGTVRGMQLMTLPSWSTGLPSAVPVLPVPDRVPVPVLLLATAVLLAGLDLAGAVAAKAWSEHRSVVWFAVGLGLFGLLFWVYGSALRYAELAEVTIAWIVVLQVGLLLIDRFRYGVEIGTPKWLAVGAILGLEAYLLLAPNAVVAGPA